MQTKGTTLREVSIMNFSADEAKVMATLDAVWVQTMDLKHDNMLVYPIDIIVEDVGEVCPRKYINSEDFFDYKCENGSSWLISTSIELKDMDLFFRNYLHLDEEGILAA